MVALARERNPEREGDPEVRFRVADLREYEFPSDLTMVYASASLLHSPAEEIRDLLRRAHGRLVWDGIWYVSFKEGKGSYAQHDEFGCRVFYYYHAEDIISLCEGRYRPVWSRHEKVGTTRWVSLVLRRS